MAEDGKQILIVDDDKDICGMLSHLFKSEGFKPLVAHNGHAALQTVCSRNLDVLLVDMIMPGMDGMEVMRRAKEIDKTLPVILITGHAAIRGAVESIKKGAYDYLVKPFNHDEVVGVVQRALAEGSLKREFKKLSSHVQQGSDLKKIMGPSDVIGRLISDVNRVAKSNLSVIIIGESGSGKDLVARAIHQASLRSEAPYIPIDCGAIPEPLLESELFGYEKGAFTGAVNKKAGKIEKAQGGTLFLDEIANLPLSCQAKLLRVIQEKKICHLGDTKAINIDVRFLAASNQDLEALTTAARFRQDLLYRLNEVTIMISPLRERKEDILYLAKRFLDNANKEMNKNVKGFSESALEVLFAYDWPGNVRQLQSVIRQAVLMADEQITEGLLNVKRVPVPGLAFTPKVEGMPWKEIPFKEIVSRGVVAIEREILNQVLKYTGGNKAKAARIVRMNYKTLYSKVKKLSLL
jgi:DNA-binding NtrC family response regulator